MCRNAFGRDKGPSGPERATPPAWKPPFEAARREAFLGGVREWFERREIRVEIDDGWVRPEGAAQLDLDQAYGLDSLAQRCALADVSRWPALIDDHFTRVLASHDEAEQSADLTRSFEACRDRLVLRLIDADGLAEAGGVAKSLHVAEGLAALLMVDMEHAARGVAVEDFDRWNIRDGDALEAALDNVLRLDCEPHVERLALENGQAVVFAEGGTIYGAARILHAAVQRDLFGPCGALVSVPTRSLAIAVPIADMRFVQALGPFINATVELFHKGPGSASHRIWWVHDGEWTHLPYAVRDGRLAFEPPQSFNDLAERLAGAEDA